MSTPIFRLKRYGTLVACFSVLASCKVAPKDGEGQSSDLESRGSPYDDSRGLGLNQEFIPKDETKRFAQYAQTFAKIHSDQQANNENLRPPSSLSNFHYRGMHAKGHGCLKGTFKVTTQDKKLQFGLFKNPASYSVYGRFSNGSVMLQSDKDRDLRGLALKVNMGNLPQVEGAKEPGKADFLMTNAPGHHAKDIEQLMRFIEVDASGGARKAVFMASNPGLTKTLLDQTQREVLSVMGEGYWSRAPYRLGPNQAVKFFVKPCKKVVPAPLNGRNPEDQLKWDLVVKAKEGNCFNMFVQPQTDAQKEPIENHQVEWKSESFMVATINFPPQELDRSAVCENAVFNPWNAHVDQKPLGNFNRARKYVYEVAEKFRREKVAK